MKNILMLLIVLAGLSTAIYRISSPDIQHKIDAQLHKISQVKSALPSEAVNTPPKKYVLDIPDSSTQSGADVSAVTNAYMLHQQDVQVRDQGQVVKVLFDDNDGTKHQRFIVRLSSGITVLIAHNIDLAPRVNALKEGDAVSFYGEYVWNEKGGIVHWTHRDPHGHHLAGWLKHNGVTYQ